MANLPLCGLIFLVVVAPVFMVMALVVPFLVLRLLLGLFVALAAALALVLFATLLVVLFARAMFAAIIAAFSTAAARPGNHVDFHPRLRKIVAFDDEFAGMRVGLRGVVANHHVQARSGMERVREGIVDEPPMSVLVLEFTFRHVQVAIADVADGYAAKGMPATLHGAKVGAARYHDFAGGCIPGDRNRLRAGGIVAGDGYSRRLRTEARGLEADRHFDGSAGLDRDRIRKHFGYDEFRSCLLYTSPSP